MSWAPLAPSTVAEKAKSGHEKMLSVSGRLLKATTSTATATSVTLANNVVYAAAQQYGVRIEQHAYGRKLRLRQVTRDSTTRVDDAGKPLRVKVIQFAAARHKRAFERVAEYGERVINIPARPFVGISEDDVSGAIDILARHVGSGAAA